MSREPLIRSIHLRDERDANEFPFMLPAVRALREPLSLNPQVTFFVGENGSGKSTLVEGMADALDLDAEGGDAVLTYVRPDRETALGDALVLARGGRRPSMKYFLRAESFYNVAKAVDATDGEKGALAAHGGKKLHGMSHGESFLTLAIERFYPDGLFILDEPEAALSPHGCMTFLRRMHLLVTEGAQFVVATHSPILLAYPGATIYALGDDGIEPVAYEDCDHYRLTRSFLEAPERFLRELFS